jgi:pilus assembly protein Flp/PilA
MTSVGFLLTATARSLRRFLVDRRGATAIEYGLMAALISVAIVGTIATIGQGIKTTFYDAIASALASM